MNDDLIQLAPDVPTDSYRQRLSSLRTRLLLLIAGITIPLLALTIGAVWQTHLSERARVEARLVDVARATAASIDSEMRSVEIYLRVVATSSSLAGGDWVSVYQQTRQSAPSGTHVAVFDDQGRRILGSAFPLPATLAAVSPEAAAGFTRRALAQTDIVVSELVEGQAGTAPVILGGISASTGAGQRVVVALIMPAALLADALRDQNMPPHWISAVVDTRDIVVTRSREAERFVGTRLIGPIRDSMRNQPDRLARTAAADGTPVVFAFAAARVSGYRTVIAIPEQVFGTAFLSTIGPVAAIGISLIAAAMGIAMLASSRILSAVRRDYAVEETRRSRDAESLREMDEELRASERRFQTIADTVPQLIWSAGPDGRHDYFNDRWHAFTGMAPGMVAATAWSDYVHPDEQRRAVALWNQSRAAAEPFEFECRLQGGDGSFRWFVVRAVPIFTRQGGIERWLGSATDIHDRKLAERALVGAQVQLEARVFELEAVYQFAPVGLAVIDRSMRFLRVNAALASMAGGPVAAQGGRTVAEVMPQFVETLEPAIRRALAGEAVGRLELIGSPDGDASRRRVWQADFYPVRQEAGEVTAVGAIIDDVTAEHEAEAALAGEKSRLERLMILAPNLIYITDFERRRNVFMNPQIYEALGYAPAELSGRSIRALNELVHPDDLQALTDLSLSVRRVADGEVREAEYRIRHADGDYRWFLIRETPFDRDAEGKVVQVLGTGLDITARRDADEHQKVLIRELHHRVKNVLATVQAIASATGRSAKTFQEFRDDFSDRLVSLGRTHSLLTREAWAGAGLHEILKSELEPYLDDAGRVTIDGPGVEIPRDIVVAVGMAVHELATNAVKYGSLSVPKGRVHVAIETDDAPVEPKLIMVWTESGGPEVRTPTRRGFGSLLLNRLLSSQLGGELAIDYRPEGIVARVEIVLRASDRT
ncbi:MAG: PAS domain S-box protein [Proteobacteria bacterium]|nr:PAS domain S-box protein [Pseudomonadota bacterium]